MTFKEVKLKEINSANAQFLPCGFEVYFANKKYLFDKVGVSGIECRYITGSCYNCFTAIMVDEEEYKTAILEKFNQIFANKQSKIEKIEKRQTGDWRGYCYVTLETASTITELEDGTEWWCTSSVKRFPTNIDLMPWEENYEITI